jgi:hypothetical protein
MKVDEKSLITKTSVLVALFLTAPFPWSIPLALFLTWVYQYLIAIFYGVHVMPTMDTLCFMGDDNIRVNFISFTILDKMDFKMVRSRIEKFMREKPKLRYKIVKIWGDYYWADTKVEDSIDYVLQQIPNECKNERDIEQLVNEDLNHEMPLNRPQWRMWYQSEYEGKYSLVVYK